MKTQCSHRDCNACAREFFKWWKTRNAQMSVRLGGTSFAEAAATSVRPPRPSVGARVTVDGLAYEHTAVVLHNTGSAGGDGRHWVQVAVTTGLDKEPWEVHVEAHRLREVY